MRVCHTPYTVHSASVPQTKSLMQSRVSPWYILRHFSRSSSCHAHARHGEFVFKINSAFVELWVWAQQQEKQYPLKLYVKTNEFVCMWTMLNMIYLRRNTDACMKNWYWHFQAKFRVVSCHFCQLFIYFFRRTEIAWHAHTHSPPAPSHMIEIP